MDPNYYSRLRNLTRRDAFALSPYEKADYFELARIRHPRISQVSDSLHALSFSRGGAEVVPLVGPPGVGKTTAIKALTDDAIKHLKERFGGDVVGQVPVLVTEAIVSGESQFSWDAFWERALERLNEPLIGSTIGTVTDGGRAFVSRSKERVAHKRARLERTMIARGVRLIIVDEALRLAEADPRLKTIRSLANTSKATVVLVGAFDLLKCLSSDGQFARRSFPIGFHRYRRSDDSKERDIFSKAVQQLERQFWPFEENPGFSAEIDLFMEATHGCFGMMKDCMSLALAHALRVGEWSPSFRYVGIKSAEQRRTILSEILAGEELWQQCNMDSSDLIKRVAA